MTWQTIRTLVAPPQHRNVTLSAGGDGNITLRLQDMSQNHAGRQGIFNHQKKYRYGTRQESHLESQTQNRRGPPPNHQQHQAPASAALSSTSPSSSSSTLPLSPSYCIPFTSTGASLQSRDVPSCVEQLCPHVRAVEGSWRDKRSRS